MGWTEYELGTLLSYEQPTPYIVETTDYKDTYSTPVLTAGKTFIIGYTNETHGIYAKNPVIIFDDFTTSTQYVSFPFKVKSSAMKILSANESLSILKFLYYRMQLIDFDHSTHKRYWIQNYSKVKVRIPTIPEQIRIVSCIEELYSELDKAVETLQTIEQQLVVYRQAVLKEAFAEERSWPVYRFGELMRVIKNGNGIKPSDNGNERILTIGSVRSLSLDLNNFRLNVQPYNEADLLAENDLLFTRYNGNKDYVGVCARVPKLTMEYAYPDKLIKCRPIIQDNDYSKFLTYYVSQGKARMYLRSKVKTTSGQNGIAGSDIKKMIVRIPQMETIREVVYTVESQLTLCDNIKQIIESALSQSKALRQSILKLAFEGRI